MPDVVDVERLREEFRAELTAVSTPRQLEDLRNRYLGRKGGAVSELMKQLGKAPAAERPRLGQLANELKSLIEAELDRLAHHLETARPVAGAIDVTLPGRLAYLGHRHPLTVIRDEMEDIFTRMGFEVVEG